MGIFQSPRNASVDHPQVNGNYGPSQLSPQSTERKGGMEILHFLREHPMLEGFALRVVTNMPNEGEDVAFELSRLSHGVHAIKDGGSRLLAIDIGGQSMPLLERANRMGVKFRFVSVPIESLKEFPGAIDSWSKQSNFAWANADNACFIKFDDVEDGYWGLEPLGLIAEYHSKLAKRLNEVARVTSYFYEGAVDMREFETPDGEFVEYYDGMNIVSETFATKLGFFDPRDEDPAHRGNIRVTCPDGLIKGDFIVVKHELIGCDLVYHTENLKPALRTDGWTLTTCMKHDPLHELRHDDQSRANFEFFIKHDRVRDDLNEMVGAFKKSVTEGGDLANYLEQQSDSFDDPIAVDYERFGTAQRIEDLGRSLKEIGIAPASFSNITFTRLGAIVRKMESSRVRPVSGQKSNFFKKMAIPAGNAISGAVITYEACNIMGVVDFIGRRGNRTFFDPRYGVVMPGVRFRETYELHGGWDLDDTVGLYLIKVYSTDQDRVADLIDQGVLDPMIDVPSDPAEAVEVGLMIRRPNGPGEYSIEAIEGEIPWYHYDASRIEVVDLADAPDGEAVVYSNVTLKDKEHEGGEAIRDNIPLIYSRGVAKQWIHAQLSNPGVGGFANLLIAWSATFGAGNLPDAMIGKMETIVDAVQQTADAPLFEEISAEIRHLWEVFAAKVIETSTEVDFALIRTGRIPQKLGATEPVNIGLAIVEAGLAVHGPWTRVQARYSQGVEFCRKLSMDVANETRNSLPLARRISAEKFGAAYKTVVSDIVKNSAVEMKRLDAEFRALDLTAGDNVIMHRAFQTQRREATEKLMDKITDQILSLTSVDPKRVVLALYKYMVTPRDGWPHGDIDRLFVQPSSEGKPSLMEVFLSAVEDTGILDDVRNS